ncbi:MAG: hypothetical protein B7Z61_14085, partial [Acidobacteria bacterium 37-71-11]
AKAAGIPGDIALADAGYGDDTGYRDGITAPGMRRAVGIKSGTKVWAPGGTPLQPLPWSGKGRKPTRLKRGPDNRPVRSQHPRDGHRDEHGGGELQRGRAHAASSCARSPRHGARRRASRTHTSASPGRPWASRRRARASAHAAESGCTHQRAASSPSTSASAVAGPGSRAYPAAISTGVTVHGAQRAAASAVSAAAAGGSAAAADTAASLRHDSAARSAPPARRAVSAGAGTGRRGAGHTREASEPASTAQGSSTSGL